MPARRRHEMRIIAQDPSVKARGADKILTTKVSVGAETLLPGPRSQRFHVVDYDATRGILSPPARLGARRSRVVTPAAPFDDRFAEAPDKDLLEDPAFRAQNTYTIAARMLQKFQSALGRRIPWNFDHHQIYLVPHAFMMRNAYYTPDDGAIYFGYFYDAKGNAVETCLSQDIIAHETTHAILDGLRSGFLEPSLPDQFAFHEAFADIAALLSVFSITDVVKESLTDPKAPPLSQPSLADDALQKSALFTLAEQFGRAGGPERMGGLRASAQIKPNTAWRRQRAYDEPHRRGEILVAAVMHTMIKMWRKRLDDLIEIDALTLDRAAIDGAKAAEHLLNMVIRSIDYCPPVEFEFEDFLEAVLVSDEEIAPDDDHRYRKSLEDEFAGFGIRRPGPMQRVVSLSQAEITYEHLNFAALQSDPEEVHRFIWENAAPLMVDTQYDTRIEGVEPAIRIGPDGFVIHETLATYVQHLEATAGELMRLSKQAFKPPKQMSRDTVVQIWGGGTIIFDQFGRAKFHKPKSLTDWSRQTRRIAYLFRRGIHDGTGKYGFASSTPRAQRIMELHSPAIGRKAEW